MMKLKSYVWLDVLITLGIVYIMTQYGIASENYAVVGFLIVSLTLLVCSFLDWRQTKYGQGSIFEAYNNFGDNNKKVLFFRKLATICLLYVVVPDVSTFILWTIVVVCLFIAMPQFVLRYTFYVYVVMISYQVISQPGISVETIVRDFYLYITIPSFNFIQILALGLALTIALYSYHSEAMPRSIYVSIVGVVSLLVLPMYVLIFAMLFAIYNASSAQLMHHLNSVSFKHRVVGSGREHYLAYLATNQLSKVISGGWNSQLRYIKQKLSWSFSNFKIKQISYVFTIYQVMFVLMFSMVAFVCRIVIISVFCSIHAMFLYIAKFFYTMTLLIVRNNEERYRRKHQIAMICGSCYEQSPLPLYVCKTCQKEHDLVPNELGIFKRRCQCGAKIANHFKQLRFQNPGLCPSCKSAYEGKESTPIVLSIIGEMQSGKTAFTVRALQQVINQVLAKPNNRTGLMTPEMTTTFNQLSQQTVSSTIYESTKPAPWIIYTSDSEHTPGHSIYTFDAAGVTFTSFDTIAQQKYLSYSDGFIFVIDANKLTANQFYETNDILDRILRYCRQEISTKEEDSIDIPIAFVIQQGSNALEGSKNHEQIEQWLNELQLDYFVRKIEMSFSRYQFFMSDLNATQEELQAVRSFEWLLQQSKKGLKGVHSS